MTFDESQIKIVNLLPGWDSHPYIVEAKYDVYLYAPKSAIDWLNSSNVDYRYLFGRYCFKREADRTMFLMAWK